MNITARTANADQLHAEVRDSTPGRGHTGCDALDPCTPCKTKTSEVLAARRAARVEVPAVRSLHIPAPRRTALLARLAAARA